MKTLFTAEAISKDGRSGTIRNPEGLLDVTLGNPLIKGIEKRGPNPELLFAGAYSACYHGALSNAAKKLGSPVKDSTVRTLVSLIEDDQGGYRLAVEWQINRRRSCSNASPDTVCQGQLDCKPGHAQGRVTPHGRMRLHDLTFGYRKPAGRGNEPFRRHVGGE